MTIDPQRLDQEEANARQMAFYARIRARTVQLLLQHMETPEAVLTAILEQHDEAMLAARREYIAGHPGVIEPPGDPAPDEQE